MKIASEQEMLEFGKQFAKKLTNSPAIIELIGDVGAGKTTFVRGLAEGLGITEPITSPSFTISKTYACPSGQNLVHYDFYRLSDPGIMQDDLKDSIDSNDFVIVEWGNSVQNILPKERIKIKIDYNEDNSREVTVS